MFWPMHGGCGNLSGLAAPPVQLPWNIESEVASDGYSKAILAQGIDPRQFSALINPSGKFFVLPLPWIQHPISPRG